MHWLMRFVLAWWLGITVRETHMSQAAWKRRHHPERCFTDNTCRECDSNIAVTWRVAAAGHFLWRWMVLEQQSDQTLMNLSGYPQVSARVRRG